MQVFGMQGVGEAKHERHVGIRADWPPIGFEEVGDIVTNRADTNNIDSGRSPSFELTLGGVIGDATLIDLPESISDQDLLVVNIHFVVASTGQANRSLSTAQFVNDVISGKIAQIPANVMIMLCGDFNSREEASGGYKNVANNTPLTNLRPAHLGWSGANPYYTLGGVSFVGITEDEIAANGFQPESIHKKTIDYMFWRSNDLEVKHANILNTLIMDQNTLDAYGLQRFDVAIQTKIDESARGYINCDHFPYFADLVAPGEGG